MGAPALFAWIALATGCAPAGVRDEREPRAPEGVLIAATAPLVVHEQQSVGATDAQGEQAPAQARDGRAEPDGAPSAGTITGLSPAQAVAAMTPAKGFQVELVAGEPDLHQPVALAIDVRGRLWVAEALQYPERAPGDEGRDDIVVFEDRDGDGKHETRTVFLTGLNLVSGLEVGYGGVWIGAAPYLLFVPDAEGDLVPDGPPIVKLDGWSFEDTHETLNSFRFGPDGWLYGCQGVFSHSRVGRPGTPDEDRAPFDAGVWRFDPRTDRFEVFAWGTSNPWGIDFDARGRWVMTACVIEHLWHVIQGGRYKRQAGSHFDAHAYEELATIADHRHYLATDPFGNNLTSDEAGGGHAHSGALVALGSAFPPEWRGTVLMGNLHGNRILGDRLEEHGSGLVGRHVGDWLVANDRWFRPISIREGADGGIYVIDWYDRQACHLTTPESWDRTNGRLYRVSFGPRATVRGDLATASGEELVAALASEREWTARSALLRLHERGSDPDLAERLERAVRAGATETLRLRSLWALRAVGAFDEERGRRLLGSADASVVAWSVQLLLEDRSVEPPTLAALVRLAQESASPAVRLALASALQRLPIAQRWSLAGALLARAADDDDANVPALLWYGVEPLVRADAARALVLARTAAIERVARHIVRRAAADSGLHAALVREIVEPQQVASRAMLLEDFVRGIGAQRRLSPPAGWTELYASLAQDPSDAVRRQAARLAALFGDLAGFVAQRDVLADPLRDPATRRAALDTLVRGQDPELCAILRGLLADPMLRGDALRALAACDEGWVAGDVLGLWIGLDASERRDALNLLASRRGWASRLVYAIGSGQIARTDVGAFVIRRIESLGDDRLTARVGEVWGRLRETSEERRGRIAELTAQLDAEVLAQADLPRGREVYSRSCQQCHVLFDRGGAVGPDLTGSNRRDLEYLLSNILDPSAVVAKDYWTTIASLQDGRLVTGIQVASTPSTITLRAENEDVEIEREEIEESRVIETSLMPEGLLDNLSFEETRDLIAYLQGPAQTPLLATASSASLLFDVRALATRRAEEAFGSEDGEIVARTAEGQAGAVLRSDLEVRDFRLAFEIQHAGGGDSSLWFRVRGATTETRAGYRLRFGERERGRMETPDGRQLAPGIPAGAPAPPSGWVRCEIEARGPRLRVSIDGTLHAEFEDADGPLAGGIALELAGGSRAMLRFAKWKLEVIPAASPPR